MSDVVTGEAVALDLRVAQLPSRLLAALIDLTVMVGVLYFVLILGAQLLVLGGGDSALAAALVVVLIVAVFLGYPVVFETLTRGRTLGKMALGLRVVRVDGGPITFRHALVRGLLGLVLERPGIILTGFGPALGLVVALANRDGRRVGDLAAGTTVVKERTPLRSPWRPLMPPPLAGWASTLDLTGVDDGLALSVRDFLSRANELAPVPREEVGQALAAELAGRTAPPPPPGTPGWAFLSAVLVERRRRDEHRSAALVGRPAPPSPVWPPPAWPPPWPPVLPQVPGQDGRGPGGPPYRRYPAPAPDPAPSPWSAGGRTDAPRPAGEPSPPPRGAGPLPASRSDPTPWYGTAFHGGGVPPETPPDGDDGRFAPPG